MAHYTETQGSLWGREGGGHNLSLLPYSSGEESMITDLINNQTCLIQWLPEEKTRACETDVNKR